MALITTDAIVLRTYNLAEADRIVLCLTRSAGLVRAVAKGARRMKSRFGAALEPFTLIKLAFYEKENRELVSMSQAEILKSRFDLASQGARIVTVEHDRLELTADGWDLFIEADGNGRVAPGTHLVFPLGLGGKRLRLDCRPADPANGFLRTTPRSGSDEIGGRFLVELATCKNAESGKAIEWPPAPLTVSGSFADLPTHRR